MRFGDRAQLLDINRCLSTSYGLPIDFAAKMTALAAICRSLNSGDFAHAQITTLFLQAPDTPDLSKIEQSSIFERTGSPFGCKRAVCSKSSGTPMTIRGGPQAARTAQAVSLRRAAAEPEPR